MAAKTLLSLIAFSALFLEAQALTCYLRSAAVSPTSNGSAVNCSAGDVCYSYVAFMSDIAFHHSGCSSNGCNIYSSYMSCVACSTNYCNSLTPSGISCYSRQYLTSRPIVAACPTGVTACYNRSSDGEAGCGGCTTAAVFNYGCSSCSTSFCNSWAPSNITCYNQASWENTPAVTTCESRINSCYSRSSDGVTDCGGCTPSDELTYGCRSCNTSNCNIQPVSCYSRSASISYANSAKVNCSIDSCYEYTMRNYTGIYYHGGCGTCSSVGYPSSNCRTCHGDNCNINSVTASTVKCNVKSSISAIKTSCSSTTSCYSYSNLYNGMTLYDSGCGSCSGISDAPSSCITCYSDYCNSASVVRMAHGLLLMSLLAKLFL